MARQCSTNYLAGRRVFAPFDQEIPNPGSMGKACGGDGFSWSNTRVDPTRVGGGHFFPTRVSWYKPTYNVMGPLAYYPKYPRNLLK
jgi:hypothetical protein